MLTQITAEDLKSALPDMTTSLHLQGLENPVELYRDPWGIPHIRAQNENDLFFAQGFATAQDRLWHMDADRHQALGRWSEFVGASGLPRDRLLRAVGMGRTAKLDYEAASFDAKRMIDAYTAGVNAFLDQTQTLPIEYKILAQTPERWENWHCLAVYKFRNTLLGTFEPKLFQMGLVKEIGAEKVASLIKGYPKGHLVTVPPGAVYEGQPLEGLAELRKAEAELWVGETASGGSNEGDFGSNAWSISGKLTQSGLPLVGGDSHRALDTPNVYYQAHLTCPNFNIIGYSVPGMPALLHFCHNEYVAWGMTYGAADTQDLFIERFRKGAAGCEYLFKDQWLPTQVLKETIKVQEAAPVEIEVTITHHGPVIAGEPQSGVAVAISDPGLLEASLWIDAIRDAMRSQSLHELHAAFRNWTDRVNNYAVADVHGNFGYLHEGKIPIRPESNGWRAVPGWTGEHEWQGYIPQEELPHTINPQVGYAVTCNQRVASHNYPYYVGLYFTPEYRAKRIQTGILDLAPSTATVADMARFHGDRISIPACNFTERLITANPLDADSEQAQALLKAWDYSMDRTLVQPTLYAKAKAVLTRWLLEDTLGEAAEFVLSETTGSNTLLRQTVLQMNLNIEQDDYSMFQSRPQGLFSTALYEAIVQLKAQLGKDMSQWQWGRLHQTNPKHPLSEVFPEFAEKLDPPSVQLHGDGDTPLAGSYGIQNEFTIGLTSVNRYIFDPADWNNSRWIVPLGASGHPGSSHFADQATMWGNVEFIPQLWDWEQIQAESKTMQRLEPKTKP